MSVEIRPFKAEDAEGVVQDAIERTWAEYNEVAGPAFTGLIDGKVAGCGGIRIHGIGEVWAAFAPDAPKRDVLECTRKYLMQIIEEKKLYRLYAFPKPYTAKAEHFAEHLGFKKMTAYIWTKET